MLWKFFRTASFSKNVILSTLLICAFLVLENENYRTNDEPVRLKEYFLSISSAIDDKNSSQWLMCDDLPKFSSAETRREAIVNKSAPPLLTLFTTWIYSKDKELVHNLTLRNWKQLKPFVMPVLVSDDAQERARASQHGWAWIPVSTYRIGVPVLKHMYRDVMARFNSTLYGYANGDILFTDSLVNSLLAILTSPTFSCDSREPRRSPLDSLKRSSNLKRHKRGTEEEEKRKRHKRSMEFPSSGLLRDSPHLPDSLRVRLPSNVQGFNRFAKVPSRLSNYLKTPSNVQEPHRSARVPPGTPSDVQGPNRFAKVPPGLSNPLRTPSYVHGAQKSAKAQDPEAIEENGKAPMLLRGLQKPSATSQDILSSYKIRPPPAHSFLKGHKISKVTVNSPNRGNDALLYKPVNRNSPRAGFEAHLLDTRFAGFDDTLPFKSHLNEWKASALYPDQGSSKAHSQKASQLGEHSLPPGGPQTKFKALFVSGTRINVNDVKEEETVSFQDVTKLAKRGKRFMPGAQDYFITDRRFPWESVPDFVVGRVFYDNWLVAMGVVSEHITEVDASDTVLAVHQTTGNDNYEGHTHPNHDYNAELVSLSDYGQALQLHLVSVHCMTFKTEMTSIGNIHVTKRHRHQIHQEGCYVESIKLGWILIGVAVFLLFGGSLRSVKYFKLKFIQIKKRVREV